MTVSDPLPSPLPDDEERVLAALKGGKRREEVARWVAEQFACTWEDANALLDRVAEKHQAELAAVDTKREQALWTASLIAAGIIGAALLILLLLLWQAPSFRIIQRSVIR